MTAVAIVAGLVAAIPTAPAGATATTTAAWFDGEPGHYIYSSQGSFPTVTASGVQSGSLTFTVSNGGLSYFVTIGAPTGQLLVPGTYEDAQRTPFRAAGHPGLDVYGNGVGCNTVSGRFVVDDATYDGNGGVLTFSARFEHHCEGSQPALFGVVSYNSAAAYRTRSISPGSLSFEHQPVGTTSSAKAVTVTNNGPAALAVASVTSSSSSFTIASDTCSGQSIASGSSCSVGVRFAPTEPGTVQGSLQIVDDLAPAGSAGEPATAGTGRDIALTGTSGSPLSFSSRSVTLAPTRVGTFSEEGDVSISNVTSSPLTITSILPIGRDENEILGGTDCLTSSATAKVLPAGGTCTIAVFMYPAAYGPRSAGLRVFDDSGEAPIDISVQTNGTEGYYLAGAYGEAAGFGDALELGDATDIPLNAPIVKLATTPDGDGYWLLGQDGGIFTYGDADFFGSTGGMRLNRPVNGLASTPDGGGYWLVADDGGIFSFGDAPFLGSTGAMKLNQPIVGMASTPDGEGYWLVASDGGIFSFGDAQFFGSTGNIRLNNPIVGMAATPTGNGYWLVASDGGIFSFGDARFYGSTGSLRLVEPIVGMASTPRGAGYWLVAADGGIFSFGDAPFFGSIGGEGVDDVIGIAGTAPPVFAPIIDVTSPNLASRRALDTLDGVRARAASHGHRAR